jgi:archaemetzincin
MTAQPTPPHPPDHKALVDVIPLGRVDPLAVQVVAANLQAILGLPADVLPVRPAPRYALVPARGQLDAGPILKALDQEQGGAPLKLGVTSQDLCLPILTFVYGESYVGGRAAVISLARLDHPRIEVCYERAAKVAVHEMGHVLGLRHCRAQGCLMRFSRDLEQLDSLDLTFCSACRYEIARARKALWQQCGWD